MGFGSSKGVDINQQVEKLLQSSFKGDLEAEINNLLSGAESLDDISSFTFPKIPVDSIPQFHTLITLLTNFLHKRAVEANTLYSNLKEGTTAPPCNEGVANRLILLHKALNAAMEQSIPLSEYLWHTDSILLSNLL